MSKYIPKSRLTKPNTNTWNDFTWQSRPFKEDLGEKKKIEEYYNHLANEKARIESIPLENLTFRDLYQFPFKQTKYGSWVYDKNSNFIFQFEDEVDKESRAKCIDILNGRETYNRVNLEAKNGEIFINGNHFITIRGCGNLTGVGAYNLNGDYASKIQDTLLNFIVEKLKKE